MKIKKNKNLIERINNLTLIQKEEQERKKRKRKKDNYS